MTSQINHEDNPLLGIDSLPIVFCLDVSPSMTINRRIENLNTALIAFYSSLKDKIKVSTMTKVAYITFSTNIEQDTNFESVYTTEEVPQFRTVSRGGTNLSLAIQRSINKLENYTQQLRVAEYKYHLPLLIIITDGNPDDNDNPARFKEVCKELRNNRESRYLPFVVGVGKDVNEKTLNELLLGYEYEAVILDDSYEDGSRLFSNFFEHLSDSVERSVDRKPTDDEETEYIMSIEALTEQLDRQRRNRNTY